MIVVYFYKTSTRINITVVQKFTCYLEVSALSFVYNLQKA